MGEDDGHPEAALRTLDAELSVTIHRLTRARTELGLVLRHQLPTDLKTDLKTDLPTGPAQRVPGPEGAAPGPG